MKKKGAEVKSLDERMKPIELKIARLRRKKSGREIAQILNITVDGYLKKEHGNARITLNEARLISNFLKLNFDEFSTIFFDGKLRFCKPSGDDCDFRMAEYPIKEARLRAKMSEAMVAEKLGITQNAYHLRETGRLRFTLDQCRILTELFNLSFTEFNAIFFNSFLQSDNFYLPFDNIVT